MTENRTVTTKYEVQYHAGNPSICRVKGLTLKQLPECEGGGWFTDEKIAKIICEALNAQTK